MSMEVDYTTPLTDAEREYLTTRGKYADIERADAINNTETPEYPEGDGTGTKQMALMTSEARATEVDRLKARLAELTGIEVDTVSDGDGDTEDAEPYEVWSVDDLKSEIDTRNEGRTAETKISKTGKQGELVARLYADDEASAA